MGAGLTHYDKDIISTFATIEDLAANYSGKEIQVTTDREGRSIISAVYEGVAHEIANIDTIDAAGVKAALDYYTSGGAQLFGTVNEKGTYLNANKGTSMVFQPIIGYDENTGKAILGEAYTKEYSKISKGDGIDNPEEVANIILNFINKNKGNAEGDAQTVKLATSTINELQSRANDSGKIQLDKLSICALFLSCICHDYKHPGLNNNYLMETNDSIAIRYNDISILENMHISETFKLIHSDPNCNIFEDFVKEKYKKIRKQMISCVIGTDMSNHKHSLEFMNKCLNDKKEISDEDKEKYMNLIVHSADISNPTKSFVIY
jgi:hypothetical protein